jgi:tryptophan synthase alpha chain
MRASCSLPQRRPARILCHVNRIESIFNRLHQQGGKALMPYLTAGDPDLATTAALLPALEAAGASICELGIPFSDPIADGPVIQASMTHALEAGVTPRQVLDMVAEVRPKLSSLGLLAMLSYSIVHRLGEASFFRDCAAAGIDGVILPDLPVDEAESARACAAEAGLTCTLLIAPATPAPRAQRIAQACTGFVYVLARAGITGEQRDVPPELPSRLEALRAASSLPMAVGFGISSPDHVRHVVRHAEAAIVGSAIMRRVAEQREQPREALVETVGRFVSELAQGLSAPGAVPGP